MEESYLFQQEKENKEKELQILCDQVKLFAEDRRSEVLYSLEVIPEDKLQENLEQLEQNSPMIRNAFIWSAYQGLVYPKISEVSSDEQYAFFKRYSPLLEGKIPWQKNNEIHVEKQNSQSDDLDLGYENSYRIIENTLDSVSQNFKSNYEFKQRAIEQRQLQQSRNIPIKSGWIPWFEGNRLYQLIWIQRGNLVYGVELEQMNFIATLISSFPDLGPHTQCNLVNGNNDIYHQAGQLENSKNTLDYNCSLAPALPHWEMQFKYNINHYNHLMLSTYFIIALLLIFILGGIFLLIIHSRKSFMDAQQKSDFVSNVSHELKTPLTSIRMYAELLEKQNKLTDEKKQKYVGIIINESQRLTRLVNNVLNFSRLDRGKHKYNFQVVELNAFIKTILDGQQMILEKHNIIAQIEGPSCFVKTDTDVIEQILINLIDNVCKYASVGKTLEIILIKQKDEVRIKVCDKGPGLPAKNILKIFNQFYQLDAKLTNKPEGVGLGLSICKQLLLGMQCDIICYNRTDSSGCCFEIILGDQK
ncbi:MAG: HAMP domain-containing histidine kinase [Lentisphaeria bacterium]|nr:HAMP domain-containing histidine kinase [Lentisphaeria bacterium]